MDLNNCRFPKEERLCRKLLIDRLFSTGKSFVVYPFRVVFLVNVEELSAPAAMMVSVPKKRFKRANKRNFIKRRVREAYRLNKHKLKISDGILGVAIAFLYIGNELKEFVDIDRKMDEIIEQINRKLCSEKS